MEKPESRMRFSLGQVLAALLTLVALMSAAVGLAFTLAPGLRPDPPPLRRTASISDIAVNPATTVGTHLRQVEQANALRTEIERYFTTPSDEFAKKYGTYSPEEIEIARENARATLAVATASQCISVYAQVTLQGFQGGSKRLTANLYRLSNGRPVHGFSYQPPSPEAKDDSPLAPIFRALRAAQGFEFTSRSESDQYVARSCLANLSRWPAPGHYFVRLELEDDDGRLLTYADSAPVQIR